MLHRFQTAYDRVRQTDRLDRMAIAYTAHTALRRAACKVK